MNTILKRIKIPPTFLSESIMGCGGQLIPPEGFMKAYDLVKASEACALQMRCKLGLEEWAMYFGDLNLKM